MAVQPKGGIRMSWRFRRSIGLGKGVRINLSKSGLGLSVGGKVLRGGVDPEIRHCCWLN